MVLPNESILFARLAREGRTSKSKKAGDEALFVAFAQFPVTG